MFRHCEHHKTCENNQQCSTGEILHIDIDKTFILACCPATTRIHLRFGLTTTMKQHRLHQQPVHLQHARREVEVVAGEVVHMELMLKLCLFRQGVGKVEVEQTLKDKMM